MRPSYTQHPAPAPGLTGPVWVSVRVICVDLNVISVPYKVSSLSSRSSLSRCPSVDPRPSPLLVPLCQLPAYLGPTCSLRQTLAACPPFPVRGSPPPAFYHLPLYRRACCHPAPSLEPQFPCTRGGSTIRGPHHRWHPAPIRLSAPGTHREAPELLPSNPSPPRLWLLPQQVKRRSLTSDSFH